MAEPVVLRLIAETGGNGDCKGGCDYAVIDLTRSAIEQLVLLAGSFMAFAARVPELTSRTEAPKKVVYYGTAEFIGDAEFGESPPADGPQDIYEWLEELVDPETGVALPEQTSEGEWGLLPLDAEIPEFLRRRTEIDEVHIDQDGDIHWQAHPLNLSTVVDTPQFPVAALQEFLETGTTGLRSSVMRSIAGRNPRLARQMTEAGL